MWLLNENYNQVEEDGYCTGVCREARRGEEQCLPKGNQKHSEVHRIAGESVRTARHQARGLLSDQKPQMARKKDGGRPSGSKESDQAQDIQQSPRRDR